MVLCCFVVIGCSSSANVSDSVRIQALLLQRFWGLPTRKSVPYVGAEVPARFSWLLNI
jgi:hypothetical protein